MPERLERHPPTFGERDTSHIMDIAHERSLAIVQGIEQAYSALRAANGDFERLIVRDQARAAVAAAAILKRRDIQTEASVLVATAEREIAKANPPASPQESGARGGRGRKGVASDDALSPSTQRDIRQAHDKLTDEQFQAVAEQAREKDQPLTREVLKREARKLNQPPDLKPEPEKPKEPTRTERVEAERDAARMDVQEKAEENEGLERALRDARGQMSEYPHEREKVAAEREAIISTLRSQLNEYMVRANEDSQSLRYWKREAKQPCRNCGTEWEFTDD